MNKAIHRSTSRILCALLICVALIGSIVCSLFSTGVIFARADETTALFTPTDMSPTNGRFATGSGSAPASPDGWTGGGVNGSNAGGTVAGILDVATYTENKDSYKLSDYAEYAGNRTPDSPFGTSSYEDTNRKVLMINIPNDKSGGTVYGYTSSDITFTANRFYRVSVWVRTGNMGGAAVRIKGMDENVVIGDINTYTSNPDQTNDYNWQQYQFYIASSAYADKTVNVSLQLGDSYTDGKTDIYRPAVGYALFDNVEVWEIAPATFYRVQEEQEGLNNDNIAVYDFAHKGGEVLFNGFTQGAYGDNEWSAIHPGDAAIYTYDSGTNEYIEDNDFGFTSDPLSANGKSADYDSSVLVISSPHSATSAGVASEPFTVRRYHYYRVSAWVKTQDVSGGNGAVLALTGLRDANTTAETRYTGNNFFATVTSCTGNDAATARGGYAQYSVYVKGSVLRDYTASVECRLGTDDGKSSGIVFFDNVTVEELSPADYNAYNGNGNLTVDFDTQAAIDGTAAVFPDTGVTNGNFFEIDEYDTDDFAYPLAPSGWTQITPATANTANYSASDVDTTDIIAGIIPTDDDTFSAYADKLGGASNPRRGDGSVLYLHSGVKTAFGYRSSAFTATANTPGILTVSLMAEGMTEDDYGASLVLKNDTRVLATIEKIKSTDRQFKTFTFYIEPSGTDVSALALEIWLGNSDRVNNKSKLSGGYVYVQSVAYTAITDDQDSSNTVTKTAVSKFAEYKAACDSDKQNGTTLTRAAYSFKTIDFTAYDAYDDNFVKYPYDWTLTKNGDNTDSVRYGIFDPDNRPASAGSYVPESFVNSPESDARGILFLSNPLPSASTLTYDGSITLSADTYYRVDVTLRVDFPEQERADAKGAKLLLSGTRFAFEDITDTVVHADPDDTDGYVLDTFRTYTFYINPGSEEKSVTLAVALGESAYSKQSSGRVYVNKITYTDITDVIYNAASDAVKLRDKGKEYDAEYERALIADLSTAEEEPTDPTPGSSGCGTLEWWIIPSILFAVAIVIALVGFLVRKLLEKKASKKGVVEKKASYDRNATLHVEHNKNASDDEKVSAATQENGDKSYAAFDDDATETAQPTAKAAEKETETADEATEQRPAAANESETESAATGEPAATNEESATASEEEKPAESEQTQDEKESAPADKAEKDSEQKEKPAQTETFFDRFDD